MTSTNTVQAGAPQTYRAGTSDAEIEAAAAIVIQKRKRLVLTLRLVILAAVLGSWELFSRTGEIADWLWGARLD